MNQFKLSVTRVIDGDTVEGEIIIPALRLKLYDQTFRFKGIDTPEEGSEGFYQATEFVAQQIEGKTVDVIVSEKDSFGRWLSVIYPQSVGKSINEQLLKNGLATVYK